jgi:hypothetical protein
VSTGDARIQDALANALENLPNGASIRIEDSDPANEAIDITPCDDIAETTEHL